MIDFRTRPPYKGFVTGGNFFPRPMEEDFASPAEVPGIYRDSHGIESARAGDFGLYLQELDASGIDMQVVQGRWVRAEMARVPNDDVCELERLYPQRFIAFPAVDPADPAGAVAELERCRRLHAVRGVSLEPGWASPPQYVDDPALDPIYAYCEEHGLICAFTLSVLAGEDLSYCDPLRLQRAAQRFPRVRFTVSHGCWPYVQEFLGVALKCNNIWFYPDFFCCLPDMPFAEQFVKAANSYLRHRMMFATSYPVRPLAQSLEQFRALPFAPGVLELLLCENARALLGIPKQ